MSILPQYLSRPVLPPPPGQKSNFAHPKTLKDSLIGLNAAFLPLALIFVGVRFYVRARLTRSLGKDDYLMLIATLATIVHSAMIWKCVQVGYGTRLWDIRVADLKPQLIPQSASLGIIYPIGILAVKLSICALYLRLFDRAMKRTLRIAVYFIATFCTLFYTADFILEVIITAQCSDLLHSLSRSLCLYGAKPTSITTGVVNTVTDLYLVILPIPEIRKLKLSSRRMLGIALVLSAGAVACGVSLARLIYVLANLNDSDPLYSGALTTEMTSVELNLGIIAASMVVMPRFFQTKLFEPSTYKSALSRLHPSGSTIGRYTSSTREQSSGENVSRRNDVPPVPSMASMPKATLDGTGFGTASYERSDMGH